MATPRAITEHQQGSILLEALFGILIFSMGILALVGLQASSIKQVNSGKYRSDANLLANQLVGEMWIADRSATALMANFSSPSGFNFMNWQTRVAAALPGASTYAPTVAIIDVNNGNAASAHRQATITVRWKPASDAASEPAHSYTLVAQIN
jgi:type IV pilus assembly protein PilV